MQHCFYLKLFYKNWCIIYFDILCWCKVDLNAFVAVLNLSQCDADDERIYAFLSFNGICTLYKIVICLCFLSPVMNCLIGFLGDIYVGSNLEDWELLYLKLLRVLVNKISCWRYCVHGEIPYLKITQSIGEDVDKLKCLCSGNAKWWSRCRK